MAENLPQGTALVAQGQISKNRKGVFGTIFEEIFVNNFNEMKKTFIQDVIVPNTKDWMYGLLSSMLDDMFFKTSGSGSDPRTDPLQFSQDRELTTVVGSEDPVVNPVDVNAVKIHEEKISGIGKKSHLIHERMQSRSFQV